MPNRSWRDVASGTGHGIRALDLHEFRSTCCTATRQCKDRTRGDEICGTVGFGFKADSTETYDVTDVTSVEEEDNFINACCDFRACPGEGKLANAFDGFCKHVYDQLSVGYDVESLQNTACTFHSSGRE